MSRKRSRRTGPKKRKLKGRERRLELAPEWVAGYRGKRNNMVKRYRKTFNVDWLCAINELKALGVELNEEYLSQLMITIQNSYPNEKRVTPIERGEFPFYNDPDSNEIFAYIAGYTSGGLPYGVTWEELEQQEEFERLEEVKDRKQMGQSDSNKASRDDSSDDLPF
jgi:hypothetical protein